MPQYLSKQNDDIKQPGTMWKYQGNYVEIIEWNGGLVRVKVRDEPNVQPFLVGPEQLTEVTTQEFREYVRKHTGLEHFPS